MTLIDRSVLTNHLLARLEPEPGETRAWKVGDHEKPREGGWQGQPGVGDWIPYFVLTATASQQPTGSIGRPGSEVWFGYAITAVGVNREQTEKASAMARERLFQEKRTKLSDGRTISAVQVTRYGGVDRLPAEPPLYLITDQFQVYTSS